MPYPCYSLKPKGQWSDDEVTQLKHLTEQNKDQKGKIDWVEAAMGCNTQRGSGEGTATEGTMVCDGGKEGMSLSNTGHRANIVKEMNMTS